MALGDLFPLSRLLESSTQSLLSGEKWPPQDEQRHPLASCSLPLHPSFSAKWVWGRAELNSLLSSVPWVVNSFKLWKEWRQVTATRARAEQQPGSRDYTNSEEWSLESKLRAKIKYHCYRKNNFSTYF